MIKEIVEEFELSFIKPREIHRVLMVIPLAALASHIVYMYMSMSKGVPVNMDTRVALVLIGILYLRVASWVFMSGDMTFELGWRVLWCVLLSIAGHRIGVYDNEAGGSLYFKFICFFSIATIMFFVVTGKTKNELKIWFNVKLNEGKNEKANVLSIANSDDGDKSSTG